MFDLDILCSKEHRKTFSGPGYAADGIYATAEFAHKDLWIPLIGSIECSDPIHVFDILLVFQGHLMPLYSFEQLASRYVEACKVYDSYESYADCLGHTILCVGKPFSF
jgi:hypothetical protein